MHEICIGRLSGPDLHSLCVITQLLIGSGSWPCCPGGWRCACCCPSLHSEDHRPRGPDGKETNQLWSSPQQGQGPSEGLRGQLTFMTRPVGPSGGHGGAASWQRVGLSLLVVFAHDHCQGWSYTPRTKQALRRASSNVTGDKNSFLTGLCIVCSMCPQAPEMSPGGNEPICG